MNKKTQSSSNITKSGTGHRHGNGNGNGNGNGHGNGFGNGHDGNGNGWDTGVNTFNPTPEPFVHKVNECLFRKDICGLGKCIDIEDGLVHYFVNVLCVFRDNDLLFFSRYECECYKGAELDEIDGRPVCIDVDECAKGYCQGGECINSPDGFKCTCPPGFDMSNDGKLCTDKDECSLSGVCANGMCINMDGTFKCQCKNGFKLSTTGRACIDIDECYENMRICLNGRCENTLGSYKCHCDRGFTMSEDGAYCIDLNECLSTGRTYKISYFYYKKQILIIIYL